MKTYAELRADVLDKAANDQDFRARLLAEPEAAVAEAIGLPMPDSVTIEVHEDGDAVAHLVLPPSGVLTDEDLSQVAAGDYKQGAYHSHQNADGGYDPVHLY